MSLLHFLKNVGGIIFVSLFLLYTFMTQAETTPVQNEMNHAQAQVNIAPLHIELKK
ncbi:hypothetical protein [Motilimonas eburnea]|uniref:hypothetical protein n=1 Tax=Motilimonas eburnea TaxID=1737488 RepID=UPI001E2DBDAA|nr:hypothetical protein [Motilimonas eburnea]MCE2571296.1 hypothetical protein [Motilimonas eburnea]